MAASGLKVFLNDMRYINPRFTYLLTYLLTLQFNRHRQTANRLLVLSSDYTTDTVV